MNVQPQEKTRMTPLKYLKFDRASDIKHEFFDGEVFAMTGANRNHNLINTSLTVNLVNRMGNSKCRVFANDMRVKIQSASGFTYPDIAVACGKLEFEDNQLDTLTNPIVLIEILFDSTEAYDRGEKFDYYRAIPTLKELILVSPKKYQVERCVRGDDGGWKYFSYEDVEQVVKIESIDCDVPLAAIYQWVEFEADDTGAADID